jgi:selenocysteine lyase/cysteine desulfurase
MSGAAHSSPLRDVREARDLFPAAANAAYFNTAAVGLASRALLAAYRGYLDDWEENGLDYLRGEAGRKRQGFGRRPDRGKPARRRIDRVGLRGCRPGCRAVRAGRRRPERGDRRARVQLEPLPVAAAFGQGIVCAARDGNLRLAIHLYNHEDDIERVALVLSEL